MSDADRCAATSHAASEEWKSFEVRMRRRRAANCRTRAERALEAGHLFEARAALDEARMLYPAPQELARIEGKLAAAELPYSADPHIAGPRKESPWAFRIATMAVLAGAAIGALAWLGAGPPRPTDSTEVVTGSAQPSSPANSVRIETIAVSAEATREIAAAQLTGAEVEPVVAENAIAAEPQPASIERSQPDESELDVRLTSGRSADAPPARVTEMPSMPPPEPSAAGTALPLVEMPAPVGTRGETTQPAPAPVREDLRVRSALARYEAAYSALDPLAAQSVWPGVDAAALARAFNSLESQRISLDRCEIAVAGASARADCSGTATWTPKVGGGPRVQARHWTFELVSDGGDWLIARATVR